VEHVDAALASNSTWAENAKKLARLLRGEGGRQNDEDGENGGGEEEGGGRERKRSTRKLEREEDGSPVRGRERKRSVRKLGGKETKEEQLVKTPSTEGGMRERKKSMGKGKEPEKTSPTRGRKSKSEVEFVKSAGDGPRGTREEEEEQDGEDGVLINVETLVGLMKCTSAIPHDKLKDLQKQEEEECEVCEALEDLSRLRAGNSRRSGRELGRVEEESK
jgi:hypothetical protein